VGDFVQEDGGGLLILRAKLCLFGEELLRLGVTGLVREGDYVGLEERPQFLQGISLALSEP